MPANLPPQYLEAEKAYREAKTPPEKLKALESMLALIPKHKGTEKLQAQIKRKISKLKETSAKKQPISREAELSHIKKEGAGQIVLVGMPNVGKSSLLAILSSATPDIGDYPFTTRKPLPGMVNFEDIQFQFIDLPPFSQEFTESWVFSLIREADLLLIVIDLNEDPVDQIKNTFKLLEEARIRPVGGTHSFRNIDVSDGKKFLLKRSIIVGNKNDVDIAEISLEILKENYGSEFQIIAVSAKEGAGLDELKKAIFRSLEIIRVYSKTPGRKADLETPFVLKKGSTVKDFARLVHKDFVEKLKFARVWRTDGFQGQRAQRDFVLRDEDIVELHM